ncbi:MAG: inositol monophosphatase family protein [Armatimonadetes bacterium]|nr:inositol monophosphatase family protein [Armatimonadota bacterium]
MNWQRERGELETLCREAGKIAVDLRSTMHRSLKPDGSIVTEADRAIETMLRTKLAELVPGSTVWGEEEGFREPGEGGLWLVDPVDGTTNFSFGSSLWGVSVALARSSELVLGCIYLPDLDEMYSASLGGGATLNGSPLTPIRPGPIESFELFSYDDEFLLAYQNHKIPGKMRYVGAFVAEAAFVFKGIFRGMVSYKANLYDAAASIAIVQELGGECRYVDGTQINLAKVIQLREMEKPFALLPMNSGLVLPFPERLLNSAKG